MCTRPFVRPCRGSQYALDQSSYLTITLSERRRVSHVSHETLRFSTRRNALVRDDARSTTALLEVNHCAWSPPFVASTFPLEASHVTALGSQGNRRHHTNNRPTVSVVAAASAASSAIVAPVPTVPRSPQLSAPAPGRATPTTATGASAAATSSLTSTTSSGILSTRTCSERR